MLSPGPAARMLAGLLLALTLFACGPAATPSPTETPSGKPLAGSEWRLVALHGDPLLEGTYISLVFEENALGGFAGCNHYGGRAESGGYTATSDGELEIPMLARTLMACIEPEGVMEQEEAYIEALTGTTTYRLEGNSLSLQDAAGETLLVFERLEEFVMDPAGLPGTVWRLVSMDGQLPQEGSSLTLAFHDDQRASGYAGCQDYVAGYQIGEQGLGFVSMPMMGPVCDSEDLLRREGEYTTKLGWANRY